MTWRYVLGVALLAPLGTGGDPAATTPPKVVHKSPLPYIALGVTGALAVGAVITGIVAISASSDADSKLNTFGAPAFDAVAVNAEGVFETLKKLVQLVLDKVKKDHKL